MLRTIIKVMLLLVLFVGGALAWLAYDMYQYQHRSVGLAEPYAYSVKSGSSLKSVARELSRLKVIRNPFYFVTWAKIQGKANKIQAGEYELVPGMTPQQFLDKIVKGDVLQYDLTLVEGWNIWQVMDAVNNHANIKHTLKGKTQKEIAKILGVNHLEGRLFPDTYHFPGGMTDVDFYKKAMKLMEERLAKEWKNRAPGLPYKNSYEALIMASIVEKETGKKGERDAISGVFVRRMNKKMLLQTDPTIIYGFLPNFDGNIRRKDIRNPHPYNTYVHRGLPPTPIAMPGAEALYAAMHPKAGKALYFVARGDGSHVFSDTLQQHNKAVYKYQIKRRRN